MASDPFQMKCGELEFTVRCTRGPSIYYLLNSMPQRHYVNFHFEITDSSGFIWTLSIRAIVWGQERSKKELTEGNYCVEGPYDLICDTSSIVQAFNDSTPYDWPTYCRIKIGSYDASDRSAQSLEGLEIKLADDRPF